MQNIFEKTVTEILVTPLIFYAKIYGREDLCEMFVREAFEATFITIFEELCH